MEKRTITITPIIFFGFFLCMLLGFLITFGIEHTGKFSFLPDMSGTSMYDEYGRYKMTNYVSNDARVAKLIYDSPLGATIEKPEPNLTVWDVRFADNISYETKFPYVIESTLFNYKYILIIGLALYILLVLSTKVKIRYK